MKFFILFFIAFFSLNVSNAQKQDSLQVVKTVNHNLVNKKLVALQATLKKLETTLQQAKTLMDELKNKKDAISELNAQDMLQLQQLMEKKGQLEQMISNSMKAASETQNNITKSLKSS